MTNPSLRSSARLHRLGFAVLILFAAMLLAPGIGNAQTTEKCSFSRDLTLGVIGEDVRCLQRYLNGAGFQVAATGVGSPGSETNLYREKTRDAVRRWQQEHGITPATGTFGPLSRAKYNALVGSGVLTPSPTGVPAGAPGVEMAARTIILNAKQVIDSIDSDIDDAEDNGDDVDDATSFLNDARDALIDALYAFINQNYIGAVNLAEDALTYADDAENELGQDEDEDEDERGGLTLAQATRFNNETVVRVIYDGDEYVFSTSADDRDEIAEEIVDEIDDEDLEAEDVEDELDIEDEDRNSRASDYEFDEDKDSAEDALEDAGAAIEDADDQIDEAMADGDETDEAEELLEDAEEMLDLAWELFDDEDYEDAMDYAEEAEELAEEAIDSL